jgi:hypothetical protein
MLCLVDMYASIRAWLNLMSLWSAPNAPHTLLGLFLESQAAIACARGAGPHHCLADVPRWSRLYLCAEVLEINGIAYMHTVLARILS